MAQRLPVQRINTGPQALRHAQRKLKLPTYVLANPRSSSLTDTFDTLDTSKWANWGAASVSNGQLVTTPNSSYSSGVTSNNPYDLTGSSVSIQLVQPPNVGTGSIENGLHVSCASGVLKHSFLLSNGNRGHFSDDFNRADGAIGAAWSAAGSPAPVISGNQFVAPTQGQWSGANSNNYATTTDHQVAVRIGTITADTTQIQLNVRVGPGNMMMSWWDGSGPTFSYNPSNTTVATGPPTSFRTGDIVTFAALGPVYTLYLNGGVVMTWTDTDTVFAYDNTYTGTLIGVQSNGADNCGFDDFWFDDIGRTLSFQTTVNGVVSTLASVNYDPVNHDFLRFREAGGTVYYETSEDGNAWDAQTSTPAVFSVSSSYIQIYAGYWGTETSPGVALWDNLNLPVSNPVYMPTKPVSRKTGPMALRQVIRQRPRAGPRPTTSPRIKVATFTETFDVLDPAEWITVSGSPSVANGLLTLPCASTYSTIMSVDMFDLNESSVYINLDQTQAAGNGTTDTIFAVRDCCGRLAQFMIANGQLITSDTASGYSSTRAYNAAAHQFLRIRANGAGTLYWDISPDASTWTQLATRTGSPFAAGCVQVYLSCGYDGVETNPLPAVFDGINLRPDWPNTRTTVKPVGRKVGPMALRQSRNLRRQQPYPRDIEGIYTADADLDVTVELTVEATVDTFIGASLATTASPVDDVDFSPALLDVDQTITVPGMEQATVTYDATGAGANSGAGTVTSLSWSHTAAAGTDVFAIFVRSSGGGTIGASAVTYDGSPMTLVGSVSPNNNFADGTLFVYRKSNVAGGTKTITATWASGAYASGNSVSYFNVGPTGSILTSAAYGNALTASQTITGASKSIVLNAQVQYCAGVDTFVSSSGGTQRSQILPSSKYENLVIQDSTSTGNVTFTSTVTASATDWASIGLVLSPAPASTAAVRTVQMLSTSSINTPQQGSATWYHTIESDATLLVVGIQWLSNAWGNPPVCTVNGLTMTRVVAGTYGSSYTGAIEYHYYANPPAGYQTLIYSGGGNGALMTITSMTFKNAKAVGSTSYVANTTSLAVSSAGPNDFLFNVIGGWINGFGGFQGYNQGPVSLDPGNVGEAGLTGWARGPSTFSITSLVANYGGYGMAALPVKPLTDHVVDANLAVTVTNTPARPSVNAPYVDSIGAGGIGTSLSFTHTVGSRANLLLVAINNATYNAGPPAVYCDGVAMTQVAVWNYGYVHLYNYSHLTWYALWNPTPGTRTITSGGAGTISGTSIAIANAGGIGSVTNSGGNPSVAGLTDQLMLNMFGGWPTGGGQNYTGYTPAASLLWDSAVATGNDGLPTVIGDWMDPSGTTTFTAVNHCGNATGAQILPIGVARQADASVSVTASLTATAAVNSVTYDSVGAGASANGGTLTWSHTLSANANCVIVGMTTNTNSYNMPTVKIGSTYLKCLGISYYDVPGNRYGMLWGMMNPPTGTQTFTVTGQVNYTSANSVAYQNVSGFSIPSYNKGAGTSLSLSMAGVDAGMIVQVLSSNAPSQITNYNRTTRYNIRDSNTYALVIGDGPGGVGATYTATNPDSSAWGTIGVSLLPRSATPTGTQYDGMGIGYAQTGGSSITFSHVATAGSYVILDMAIDRNITLSNVLYAGQAMTLLGSARFTGQSGNAGMYRYGIANAPGGLSTVTATTSATTYFAANTTGYINVGYMSAPQTASGNGSAPSQAVTLSESDQIAIESIGVYANTLGTLTGDNNLLAFSWANMSLVINDATASTTFTTGNTGVNWGAIYTILSPVDTSLAATATITADADIRQGIWQVDSTTVASTATLTATATRNIFADSPQVITTTLTNTGTRNAIVDSLQAITVGEIGQDVVAFDSVGVGATGSGTPKTITWNHTISPSANYVIMAVSTLINGTNNYSIYTALLGSTPMTYLGGTDNYDTSPGPYAIYFWGMANPPTGTQTFSVGTSSLATYLAANTVAYRNVGEVSPIYTKAGAAGTSFSHGSINSETGEIVVQAFAQGQNILIGSYNQTSRYNVSGAANVNAALLIGEAAGGSALTFTATSSASDFYGSVAIALIPAPSSTRNANVDSSQALTVTETQTGLRNAIVNSATQAITAAPSGLPNAGYKVSAPQAITASPSTAGSYGAVGNTSLALTETASSSGLRVAATDSSLALTAGRIGSDLSPAWAATGPGTAGNAGILSFTDTIPVGTSYTLVWSQMLCASSSPTVSVTIGGVSATLVDSLQIALTGGNNLFLFCFGLANPPTGSQTVSYTTNSNLACPVNTVHYSRVSRANSVAKLGYQSGQPSITLPVNDSRFMYAQAFGYAAAAVGNSYTAYNQSQRYITSAVANVSGPLLIGDAAGTGGSLTFSATRDNTSYSWGTIVVVLATSNPFAAIGTTFDSSQAITVGEPGNVKWALNAAAPLAITVDLPALENESSVISTPLEVTASFTAEITKTRLIEGGTQELTVTPTADMLRNANTDSVAGAIATITSVAQRNAGVDSSSVVIAAQNSIVKWGALFAVSQPIAATTSITATRAARVDALLALAATAEATPHIDHPASSSLVLTVSDSAATFNADFVTAATMLTSASSSVTALRSIYFDAELVITETATSQVKWSLKAQATHVITVDSSGTATRNARVDASLLAALGRDGYMFQTESFDVPLNVIADLTAILNITTTLESPTLDVLADLTGRVVRILFADSDPIDITVEIPQSDFLLSHYAEAVVAVNNTLDGSAVLDAVCNVTLEVSADASVIINQDAIIDTDLQIEAIFVSDMLMDAIIDAYLSANTDLATKTIRGQYIDAEQELVFTVTEETKWNIMMQALLNVPVTTTVDTRFGQATSNFFVFYL